MESLKAIKIALIFLLIFTVLSFIYFYKDKATSFFNLKTGIFKNFILPANFLNFKITEPSNNLSSTEQNESNSEEPKFKGELPIGFEEKNISPYYGRFSVSASPSSEGSSYPSTIRIYFGGLKEEEKINTTGWSVRGNKGTIFVSKGAEIFQPISGGPQSDIIIKESLSLNLYSSVSPMNVNFRTNKCFGYISQAYTFSPSIGGSCPSIDRKEYQNLPGSCQDTISSYNGSCRYPGNDPNWNFFISDECKQVLNRFNYTSCFNEHKKDENFVSSDWHIWTGQNILDSRHDRVILLDSSGKYVSETVY